MKRVCECGSASLGSPAHSDWCPLHENYDVTLYLAGDTHAKEVLSRKDPEPRFQVGDTVRLSAGAFVSDLDSNRIYTITGTSEVRGLPKVRLGGQDRLFSPGSFRPWPTTPRAAAVRETRKTPPFQVGDRVICNHPVANPKNPSRLVKDRVYTVESITQYAHYLKLEGVDGEWAPARFGKAPEESPEPSWLEKAIKETPKPKFKAGDRVICTRPRIGINYELVEGREYTVHKMHMALGCQWSVELQETLGYTHQDTSFEKVAEKTPEPVFEAPKAEPMPQTQMQTIKLELGEKLLITVPADILNIQVERLVRNFTNLLGAGNFLIVQEGLQFTKVKASDPVTGQTLSKKKTLNIYED